MVIDKRVRKSFKKLENILLGREDDNTKLRAIELIYKLSGIIKDDKISLNINNENKVLMDNICNSMSIDDFYEN